MITPVDNGAHAALREALDDACAPLVVDGRPGPGLARSVERCATTVLHEWQRRGTFERFSVQARWAPEENGCIVEIALVRARRVEQLVLRLGGLAGAA